MKSIKSAILLFVFVSSYSMAGTFSGDLILTPEGCQKSKSKICNLGEEITYDSIDRDGHIWKTNKWEGHKGRSGTTDGASIPGWAQFIIGDRYDESYLKAAILHDHYCYKENQVRSWKETHRMFYNALMDLGVGTVKAKTMYFAVYLGGPRWEKLVAGENCGSLCVQSLNLIGSLQDPAQFNKPHIQTEISKIHAIFKSGEDISLEGLEARARAIRPESNLNLTRGVYEVQSLKDKKVFPFQLKSDI